MNREVTMSPCWEILSPQVSAVTTVSVLPCEVPASETGGEGTVSVMAGGGIDRRSRRCVQRGQDELFVLFSDLS